ncbi:MAG: hypothetical protein AAB594_01570 [Patescibacteria group bacterium]
MPITDKFALIVLVGALGAQILYRRSLCVSTGWIKKFFAKFLFSSVVKFLWVASFTFIISVLSYWSWLQYEVWKTSPVMKYALPPHQGLYYFFSYVGVRFLGPWVLAFLAALLVSRLAKKLNKRFEDRFFESEEIELMTLGIFLTGYPGFFIYLILILGVGSLVSVVYTLFSKGRMPFYYLWIPLALSAIIIENWLIPKLGFADILGAFSLGDFVKDFFGF